MFWVCTSMVIFFGKMKTSFCTCTFWYYLNWHWFKMKWENEILIFLNRFVQLYAHWFKFSCIDQATPHCGLWEHRKKQVDCVQLNIVTFLIPHNSRCLATIQLRSCLFSNIIRNVLFFNIVDVHLCVRFHEWHLHHVYEQDTKSDCFCSTFSEKLSVHLSKLSAQYFWK